MLNQQISPAVKLLRVFIVEDSEVILASLIPTLEELAPLKVVGVAQDGPAAVLWLSANQNSWDAVIIDLFLRIGSGIDVLQAVKRSPDQPKFLVVLSNYATSDMRRRCLELGADRVFDKSSEIEELAGYLGTVAVGG
jgi:DNA-binding NarL/FixJ family response regulator